MGKKLYEESSIAAIAGKIREKTYSTNKYTTAQMPDAIDEVYTTAFYDGELFGYQGGWDDGWYTGWDEGYLEGESFGYQSGYTDGETAGAKAQYDAFWDAYQQNGNRGSYDYAFAGRGWTDDTFKPKYDIKPIYSHHMFSGSGITDLVGLLKTLGRTIDFSNDVSGSYVAQGADYLTTFPTIDTGKRPTLQYFMYNCPKLHTVEKVILKDDGSQTFAQYSFMLLPELVEIRFEGVIGKGGLTFQWSTKLSKESITSVINALSTTTSGLTVVFSKTAKEAAFTAEEWAALIATKPNWTISLV